MRCSTARPGRAGHTLWRADRRRQYTPGYETSSSSTRSPTASRQPRADRDDQPARQQCAAVPGRTEGLHAGAMYASAARKARPRPNNRTSASRCRARRFLGHRTASTRRQVWCRRRLPAEPTVTYSSRPRTRRDWKPTNLGRGRAGQFHSFTPLPEVDERQPGAQSGRHPEPGDQQAAT